MTTKKLRIPILLLALWLIAATVIPQSYAAGGTHRGEVKNGTGYIQRGRRQRVRDRHRPRHILCADRGLLHHAGERL